MLARQPLSAACSRKESRAPPQHCPISRDWGHGPCQQPGPVSPAAASGQINGPRGHVHNRRPHTACPCPRLSSPAASWATLPCKALPLPGPFLLAESNFCFLKKNTYAKPSPWPWLPLHVGLAYIPWPHRAGKCHSPACHCFPSQATVLRLQGAAAACCNWPRGRGRRWLCQQHPGNPQSPRWD